MPVTGAPSVKSLVAESRVTIGEPLVSVPARVIAEGATINVVPSIGTWSASKSVWESSEGYPLATSRLALNSTPVGISASKRNPPESSAA